MNRSPNLGPEHPTTTPDLDTPSLLLLETSLGTTTAFSVGKIRTRASQAVLAPLV